MQISRIYSNFPEIFTPVEFNYGHNANRLNVIIGEVRKPRDRKSDSHNLGKTTLLNLIDFLMLKGVSSESFLFKHKDRFSNFKFYLEIALNSGDFATVRRSVEKPTEIALARHTDPISDFDGLDDSAWTHLDLPIDEAIRLLDAWLDLRILKPYDYRKAITYFLRSQADWGDELQLKKFSRGADQYWKPFVAHLFGFKETPVLRKYELDEEIKRLRKKKEELQSEVQYKENDLPELTAKIAILRQQAEQLEEQLDAFQFDAEERRIVKELVGEVEREIADLNQLIYNVSYDIKQIDISVGHKDKFDLKEVASIFEEAKLHFPDQLKRQYEELVEFKRQVTKERHAALRARRKVLIEEQRQAEQRKAVLDVQREKQLSVLRSGDTLEKYKSLQRELGNFQAQLFYLEGQRTKLENVAETARQMREAERDRGRVVDEIKAMVARPNPVFVRFRTLFNSYCQRVLNHEGLFFFNVNSSDNLDYNVSLGLKGHEGTMSSQGDGTSYKKLVCALFDLALLKVYEHAPFFHFVYHDGMLEALDNRKKNAFLELVREQIADKKTQYIMTVIASDLPRNSSPKSEVFHTDEIILRLHDDGNDGRLFKMAEF